LYRLVLTFEDSEEDLSDVERVEEDPADVDEDEVTEEAEL
jgi:hypothetical protein